MVEQNCDDDKNDIFLPHTFAFSCRVAFGHLYVEPWYEASLYESC